MIQVQRFNKALKSAVIIGDLVILDVLFVLQYILWTTCLEQKVSDGTLPQILVLFSLCYFACTISRGIILHRRGYVPTRLCNTICSICFISYCCP